MNPHTGMGLTPGQAKVLAVIKRWLAREGVAPTYLEIAQQCGWASKSTAWRVVTNLVKRGYVRRNAKLYPPYELIEQPPRYRFIPVSDLTWKGRV